MNDKESILNDLARPQGENDLKEALLALNDDTEESDGLSKIDMRTRLTNSEIQCILSIDVLVNLKVLPKECYTFTRSKKRLAISLQGKGREEMVSIVKSETEAKKGETIASKMM